MHLKQRIDIMVRLGEYMLSDDTNWLQACAVAHQQNAWFTKTFIDSAIQNITTHFLQRSILEKWAMLYAVPTENKHPVSIGIVMAGNIPLVGFHDFLCAFIAGHHCHIKLSSKDSILLKNLAAKLYDWDEECKRSILLADMLKGCDAYIATGSNNASRYFEYYFSKYPHIIRRNRTSVAILTGEETTQALEQLADDICLYFGLGCRNVTHIFVPTSYNFMPLLEALSKYDYFKDIHKYKNNYDYNLALHLLNRVQYMTNESILLIENASIFSPIAQLNYSFYIDVDDLVARLPIQDIQCVIGRHFTPFGSAQAPHIIDYADGVDTMKFVLSL